MKKLGIIVFICAMFFGIVVAGLFSYKDLDFGLFSFGKCVAGSGVVKTQKIEATDFKSVDVSGVFKVEITSQRDFAVDVEADDNLLPFIKVSVDGETLKIETERKISSKNPIVVRISAPDIESIGSSGASQVSLVNLDNERLSVDANGASTATLEGKTKDLNLEISGASRIEAFDLFAENAAVVASGASLANLFASNDLKVEASGASKIYYSGNPKDLSKDISGASVVREK